MRASIKELLDEYQVRRSLKQKQAFIDWLKGHAQLHDYKIYEQTYKKGRSKNLIIGNPKTAQAIVTAHYDTPPSALIPIVTVVGNIPIYILGQLAIFFPIIALIWMFNLVLTTLLGDFGIWSEMSPFLWFEVPFLVVILLIMWCLQMMMGVANRKNANDNTSGVAVLVSLLEELSQSKRDEVCFVFFDEEEKGLEGAKVFKKTYQQAIKFKPLINFDCVAHGKYLMFITKKEFRESRFNDILADVTANKALMKEAKNYVYPSDQLIFKNSVGVTAVHKFPVLGYYLSRLHSRFDTKFNANQIEELTQIMMAFIETATDTN